MEIFKFPPTFVPTPTRAQHRTISSAILDFVRKLQWQSALPLSQRSPPRFGLVPSSRWPPSRLVPPDIRRLSSLLLSSTRSFLRSQHDCFLESNLSHSQREALENVAQNDDVTIRPADKGAKWVVMKTSHYNHEALRQLHDETYYQADPPDTSLFLRQRLRVILTQLHKRKFLSKKELLFLLPHDQDDTRRFYMLPKLHKDTWPQLHIPPGRPIVSDVKSLSYNCSRLLEYFLSPLVALQDSYLRDTGHLIATLRETSLEASDLLFTCDIDSLYTNVPLAEGLQIISQLFIDHPDPSRPDRTLLTILELLLSQNSFSFCSSRWLQVTGVAMGKVFSGSFANLFLSVWEQRCLSTSSFKPVLWKRYQDDIFGVWRGSQDGLREFHAHMNLMHPNIRCSLSFGSQVHFLDLTVSNSHGNAHYKLFCKPTDSNMLLPPNSHHPRHTFSGLLFSQVLRLSSRSSERCDFEEALSCKSAVWRAQGYTRTSIRRAKAQVLSLTQQHLDWPTGTFCCDLPCSACSLIQPSSTIHDSASNNAYPIMHRICCSTTHVIYAATCSHNLFYVGQTEHSLHDRIVQHLHTSRSQPITKFHTHFSSCSMRFIGLERVLSSEKRLLREAVWIKRLHAALNTQQQARQHTHKTTLVLPFTQCARQLADVIRHHCHAHTPSIRVTYRKSPNLRELFSR